MTDHKEQLQMRANPPRLRLLTVVQGEIEISNDPNVMLSTILGSCIAVCMWDPRAKVGGMNHFLLAEGGGSDVIKYGAYAMEMLINRLLRSGAQRNSINSKIFGGASTSGFAKDIGQRNAEFARNFLSNEGIPCLSESVGGNRARRVRFSPTLGTAQMLFVQPTELVQTITAPVAPNSSVTLF